jgi:hypothetical protein
MEENPITESINHLQHCGWTKDEAVNLLRALHSDDPEKLWEFAPEWIEMVGRAKMDIAMYELVAKGLANVTKRDSEWMYALSKTGLEVGKQLNEGQENGGQ